MQTKSYDCEHSHSVINVREQENKYEIIGTIVTKIIKKVELIK